jgi:hypothetical protein
MNPSEDHDMAARRRTTRRRTTRRAPARRANPRRRRRRTTTTPRRRRRRRNPSFDVKGTAMAGLGGAAMGGAAYALEGYKNEKFTPPWRAAALAVGGALLGVLASGYSKSVGAGIAGGGLALGTKVALDHYMAKKDEGLGYIPAYARQKFGYTAAHPGYFHAPAGMGQLGAVDSRVGAYDASLQGCGAVQADLI